MGVLSRNLDECREENSSLKSEIASLREQNSFLRGMLSAAGLSNGLPPALSDPQPADAVSAAANAGASRLRRSPSIGGGGGGGTRAAGGGGVLAGAGAIAGAVGASLAVVSCVAFSAAGYDDGDDLGAGNGGTGRSNYEARSAAIGRVGRAAGRRVLMSIDGSRLESVGAGAGGVQEEVSSDWFASRGVGGGGFTEVLLLLLLMMVAYLVYDAAMKRWGKDSSIASGVGGKCGLTRSGYLPMMSTTDGLRKLL